MDHNFNRCRIIIGTQKGTIILTTTHFGVGREPPRKSPQTCHVSWAFLFGSGKRRFGSGEEGLGTSTRCI